MRLLGVLDERDTLLDVLGEVREAGVKEGLLGGSEGSDGVDLLDSAGLQIETVVSGRPDEVNK